MNFLQFQKYMGRFVLVNFRLRIIFFFLIILCFFGVIINFFHAPDIKLCFVDTTPLEEHTSHIENGPQKLEDVLIASAQPDIGNSIFFHETSCGMESLFINMDTLKSETNIKFVNLSARQACAIESAAVHNPSSKVFVLFASPRYMTINSSVPIDPIIKALYTYTNIHLRNVNLWTYAYGTPIYEWFMNGLLFKSKYVLSHLSDFLRYLTLWRWGGTYLDMDIVMLRSMEDLPPNFTGAESNTHLAAGVMNFDGKGFGHEIAEMCIADFQRNFNGQDWGNNGPGVITRVIQRICQTNNIELMQDTKSHRCLGFRVFPIDAFYAIHWMEWSHFFESDLLEQTLTRLKNSYVAHVWNKHSKKRQIKKGTMCAYSVLAEKNCPRVYSAVSEFF